MAHVLTFKTSLSAADAARGAVLVQRKMRQEDAKGRGVYGDHVIEVAGAKVVPASWGMLMGPDYRVRCLRCGRKSCPSTYAEAHIQGIISIDGSFRGMKGTRYETFRLTGKKERDYVVKNGVDPTESAKAMPPKGLSRNESKEEKQILKDLHTLVISEADPTLIAAKIEALKHAEEAKHAARPQPKRVEPEADDDDDPTVISAEQASVAAKTLAAYSAQKKAAAAAAS
jgi:hypothetical protein